ncbi:asparagine synthase (glutamine-hydrolyzing) [Microvirga sp. VF16]|uniref:asparagine synthase (glutamine-hydrolyzing) n=1 Tax=Microvirga sp. VF16 TaxID=2807101 RepID=UPI00193E3D9F|nr:asparagine synthase (glutamine-hydrolyzing) [Microvirga sp. VF16]QRM27258.1 asparagine synthase (glutamine-hydrolyzing) [Microvirga sp. VF16]
MCGIAGFLFPTKYHHDEIFDTLQKMTDALVARGPDDEGHWIDMATGVALGHRRLSIIDLSPAGHQPMMSASGRYVLIFNGEIYNHLEIRRELDTSDGEYRCSDTCTGSTSVRGKWRSTSDTESLLAAIDAWGVNGALMRCVGMFSVALWDKAEHTLTLVRDRLGEKPLYYGWSNGMFIFASELKAFHSMPGFSAAIDKTALWHYFCQRAVPAPYSIYEGIRKLEPGQILTLHIGSDLGRSRVVIENYWSLEETLKADAFRGTANDAVEELARLLKQAISLQMVADVPVGAFLSGGIDSATVVALMQSLSNRTIQTYTMAFEENSFNEGPYAAAIAQYLGTNHTELTVTTSEALTIIPRLPDIWDEPFADSSQIPTAILTALARRNVTVALSGDGGDELFCGYKRQLTAAALERIPAKNLVGALLFAFNSPRMQMHLRSLPLGLGPKTAASRLAILSDVFTYNDPAERYMAFSYDSEFSDRMVRGVSECRLEAVGTKTAAARDILSLVSAVDTATYLPTDILTKVDRAAMAVSLETRVPFLDHRVVEFAFSLPSSFKVRNNESKWPLRQILREYVPSGLFDRPKMGFGVPIRDWLRGPLRSWAADLLLLGNSRDDILDKKLIERIWRDHQSGAWDYAEHLWRVLMFRAWQMRYER